MDNTTPTDLISRPEAGRLLGVGPGGINGLVSRGELTAWRVGQRVKLSKAQVMAYLSASQI